MASLSERGPRKVILDSFPFEARILVKGSLGNEEWNHGWPMGSDPSPPKGGLSLLLGVLQDAVGNARVAVLLLHDRQCGRGVDLRNVVVIFQGSVGKRSFEVRLDRRPFCMHVLHT